MRQLLGRLPGDDFEPYSDKIAVAARYPKTKKPSNSSSQAKNSAKTDKK
jgi:hypothetical protein